MDTITLEDSMDAVTYVVIPTRDRHGMLADCIASIQDKVDSIFVIDNRSFPAIAPALPNVFVIRNELDPPNISTLWNVGLRVAHARAQNRAEEAWNVLVLNSDVICPPNLVATLNVAMRATGAALAYPDQFGGQKLIMHTQPGPVDMQTRITGYAFMLRGELVPRFDEQFGWWYGDDDMDWQSRMGGGSILVPGCPVRHLTPNSSTNADSRLAAQTTIDRQRFIAKWGKAPH